MSIFIWYLRLQGISFNYKAHSCRCSCVFINTDVKIGIFLISILIEIETDKNHTSEVKVMLPFSCLMFKFSFICNYYNLYVNLRLKMERTKLAFL